MLLMLGAAVQCKTPSRPFCLAEEDVQTNQECLDPLDSQETTNPKSDMATIYRPFNSWDRRVVRMGQGWMQWETGHTRTCCSGIYDKIEQHVHSQLFMQVCWWEVEQQVMVVLEYFLDTWGCKMMQWFTVNKRKIRRKSEKKRIILSSRDISCFSTRYLLGTTKLNHSHPENMRCVTTCCLERWLWALSILQLSRG